MKMAHGRRAIAAWKVALSVFSLSPLHLLRTALGGRHSRVMPASAATCRCSYMQVRLSVIYRTTQSVIYSFVDEEHTG
jgi:hypothetical protein